MSNPNIRLFCFPYAGAGAVVFRRWRLASSTLDVRAVDLPGRGTRRHEALVSDLPALIARLSQDLHSEFDSPFAFFGHSLGAVIAFELARHLRDTRGLEPSHLFLSAHRAPHSPLSEPSLYNLPEELLIAELQRLGSNSVGVLNDPDLRRMFVPVLRADLEISDKYRGDRDSEPLRCPITAFAASEDVRVRIEDVKDWGAYTTGNFAFFVLPGNHLFLDDPQSPLLDMIASRLTVSNVHAASFAK